MSSVEYIVSNYLRLLGVEERTRKEMLAFLAAHPGYPSLRSVVECFEEWQFECTATSEMPLQHLKDLQGYFLVYSNLFEGSFALVLSAQEYQITYLNAIGQATNETYEEFSKIWQGVVFLADIGEFSGRRRPGTAIHVTVTPKLLDRIRVVSYNQEEPITWKIFRPFSVYISWLFVRLKISQHVASILWIFCVIGASWLVASGMTLIHRILSILLILCHFLFDCADGEIARTTKSASQYGSNLEQVFHWISNMTLVIAASFGQFEITHDFFVLEFGLFVLAFDSLFHFYYLHLGYWLDGKTDYGWLANVSHAIYRFMPINTNLFLVSCIVGRLEIFLYGWGCLSFILFLLLAVGYFRKVP